MNIQRATLLPVIILLMTAFSCTRDRTEYNGPEVNTRSDSDVTLALRLPSLFSTQEATVDENLIKSVYILAFRDDAGTVDGDELYDYSALAYSVADGSLSREKTVKARLLKKDYPQKLVLIANAKSAVEDLDLESGTKTKKEVLEMLEFGKSDEWHSGTDGFIPIPMWGESERLTIDDNTATISTIILTRMVSRIDVVKDDNIDDDQFTLTSLYLYNHHVRGRVAPERASTHWSDQEWKAIHPTPPSTGKQKTKGPLSVDAETSGTTQVLPTVYAFETEASEGPSADATCVVIGGKYNGSGKESFYRVDFVNKDSQGNFTGYKHLLRNHIYRININDVYGGGHETPGEAFESQAVNIDAEVKEWDEGSISDVVFDRDYMLGVSQTEYYLAKNYSEDNLLIVTTDVPAGGTLTCDADWLTLGKTQFPADVKEDVPFTVQENNTGSERTAKIKVSAGRLSIVVTVVQDINDKLSLHVENEAGEKIQSLLFTSYGDGQTFTSQIAKTVWTPTSEACMVSHYDTGNYGFSYAAYPFTDPVIHGGQQTYAVVPTVIAAGQMIEKTSRVNFVVGEGSQTIVWPLTLRQIHYELLADPDDSYPLDGNTYQFLLTTNADWTVEITGGNHNLASLSQTSGSPSPAGEPFKFTMANDPDGKITDLGMTLTFTYTGEDGRSATKTVVINAAPSRGLKDAEAANSYILQPDGDGVSIPLAWANGSENGQMIGASDDVTVKVIWLDTNRGIADNSVISSYKLKGNGATGEIEVYPGSQEGNALIAAVVNGEIKWSWHIWVTNYDIEGTAFSTSSNTYMNINLGAITDSRGSIDSYGLMYQFGRKDPFPHRKSDASAGNVQQDLWDEQGNPVNIILGDVTVNNNILKSLSTPTTFYKGVSGNDQDWTTNSSTKRTDLWNGAGSTKTHYDPCPGGWRTALPASGYSRAYTDLGTASGGNATSGFIFGGSLSYWQFGGMITHQGVYQMGRYGNGSLEGFYWGATTNGSGQYAYSLYLTSTWPQNDAEIQRASGMNVRCIKEK